MECYAGAFLVHEDTGSTDEDTRSLVLQKKNLIDRNLVTQVLFTALVIWFVEYCILFEIPEMEERELSVSDWK